MDVLSAASLRRSEVCSHFRRQGMEHSVKSMLIAGLMASIIALWVCPAAGVESGEGELVLQPQLLNHAGVETLRQLDPNLRGSGVKLALVCRSITYVDDEPQGDYRPNVGHRCLEGKHFSFHDESKANVGISPHSTAICSILFGEDRNGYSDEAGSFNYEGVIPEAEADVYEFWHFAINYVLAGLPPEADIVTASIGSQFEYWWTRGIESLVENYGLIVVAGIGNGLNAHDPPLYPGAGANVIGVGVVDSVNSKELKTRLAHFALAYPEHSSFGPTIEGRCKPDIVAPGNCLAADANDANRYEQTGSWSSFSTPVVAGTAGLLLQKARQDPNLRLAVSRASGNCVIKAILMNSATKLPYWHKGLLQAEDDHEAPLDHIQGAGMLNAGEAYRHLVSGRNAPGDVSATGWDNNYVDNGENRERVYKIRLAEPNDKTITATIVWNRHYDVICPFEADPERDTDLRLEVWAVDPNDVERDYLLDYSDSRVDNVEHIYCMADANYTDYEVVVSWVEANKGQQGSAMEERYGLAWDISKKKDTDNNIFLYDLNADGIVDESDSIAFVSNWLMNATSPDSYALGDINEDGVVESKDLQVILDHKGLEAGWRTK